MEQIVLTLSSRAYPLTAVTSKDEQARVTMLYGAFDPKAGTAVSTHELRADPAILPELEAAHAEAYPNAVRVDANGTQGPSFTVECDIGLLEKASSPELFAFKALPVGTVLGPTIIKGGAAYIRAVVPGVLDLVRVQDVYNAGAEAGRWTDFQVIRTAAFDAKLASEAGLALDLTPKQFEVVKAALALGYYDSPRKVTLQHLSDLYGISKAAAHNRLQAAERKIIQTYFS